MKYSEYRIKLLNELREIERVLADRAREFIECSGIYKEGADMEKNQIRNLIHVSEETRCYEAIRSFICYQISRSPKSKGWNFSRLDTKFGEALINEFDKLYDKHLRLIKVELARDGREEETFWSILRLYLGYLNWSFVALRKSDGEEE